ncbi:MAG: InlB B-repeat-containing protein [Bacteroidales bacterium]|nr:InlB B-repeat-containing protein [Bacteroidales bacterium]
MNFWNVLFKAGLIVILSIGLIFRGGASPEPLNFIESVSYTVKFNLNNENQDTLASISVEENGILQIDDKPIPTRSGYRFAGWYTSAACKPHEEWLFGKMLEFPMPNARDSSMLVTKSMTLFAKWVSPVHIKDIAGLVAIQNDLKGWYILDNNIDMSGFTNWTPIGEYDHTYEWARGEWWSKAFQGIFDGQGHTIYNLHLTNSERQMLALFGSVANGEIVNLKIDNCIIDIVSSGNYVSPLVAILKEDSGYKAKIENCTVSNLKTKINFSYSNPNHIFSSVTGLAAGAWKGSISYCHVSGAISLETNGIGGTGGELYVGGIVGEGYSNTIGCSSDIDITVSMKVSPLNKDQALKLFVGGLQASATNVKNAISTGDIKIEGCPSITELYVGGLIGSERYGVIENCASQSKIYIQDAHVAQIGGIVGEFSKTYGGIGTAFGVKETIIRKCYASGEVSTFQVDSIIRGGILGVGLLEPLKGWGGIMNYKIMDCVFISSEKTHLVDDSLTGILRYNKIKDVKGFSLKPILGEGGWRFQKNKLPFPNQQNKL